MIFLLSFMFGLFSGIVAINVGERLGWSGGAQWAFAALLCILWTVGLAYFTYQVSK